MLCVCDQAPSMCPVHNPRELSLRELREQRILERKDQKREDWLDTLPHLSECNCPCHRQFMDDGECSGIPFRAASNPPIYVCCYGGSRRPTCGGCERSTWRVHEVDGVKLCRECRRALR